MGRNDQPPKGRPASIPPPPPAKRVEILIDGLRHKTKEARLTGRQIRLMAELPDSFDLYVHDEMADYDDSREVGDNELVTLEDGLRFFSADPRDI